ncbi:hypothetical protein [Butyrivibrio hungatei]|uniref:Uncharacterized protein n=1 Tax=Butyrivibrio hungatei TaxID=185008 RepID=A0A1D9P5J0_9FIRM|nr:hypothetical protein [Butyrivibrio hungatei]AOZ97809.1 hypothetical protein bhn_II010 [Butyrivibrio hungatei]
MSDFFSGIEKVELGKKGKVSEPETKERKTSAEKKANDTSPRTKTEKIESEKVKDVTMEPSEDSSADEEKPKDRRGRKPTGKAMERKFISVNIGDGVGEDLNLLIKKYEMETGKRSVGVGTYIRYLIDKDIEENRDYIDKARKYEELLFGDLK